MKRKVKKRERTDVAERVVAEIRKLIAISRSLPEEMRAASRSVIAKMECVDRRVRKVERIILLGAEAPAPWDYHIAHRELRKAAQVRKAAEIWHAKGYRNLQLACRDAHAQTVGGYPTVEALCKYMRSIKEDVVIYFENMNRR